MFQRVRYKPWLTCILLLVLAENALGRGFGRGFGWFRSQVLKDGKPDGALHAVAACQEDKMVLQCKNEFNHLEIQSAFYGRDNKHTCRSRVIDSDTECNSADAAKIERKVRDLCQGETRCQIPVTKTFFSGINADPVCPGIRKYLRVKYTCNQVPHIDMTCAGSCNNNCWPKCESSCCNPPPPPPPKPLVLESLPALVQHEALAPGYYVPGSTCPSSCNNQCAPLCTANCCHAYQQPLPAPNINQEVLVRPTQPMYGAVDTALIESPSTHVVPLPARRIGPGAPIRLPPRPMLKAPARLLPGPAQVLALPPSQAVAVPARQAAAFHQRPHRYNPRPLTLQEESPLSCPYSCQVSCRSYCAPRCCTQAAKAAQASFVPRFQHPNYYNMYRPQPSTTSLELARRRSYQTLLARYRAKQMAEYYGRQHNGKK